MRLMLFAPFALYLGYLVYERFVLNKCRKCIKHIIHINGIRGKTGTARLIDAGLREAGLRVFTKTTGNIPSYINVSGEERPI
ncbi:MAG TPA: poly-gamma-glutamate synthase PgsB, partial [Clostridia bacterium]|nr:poly-gamma-glutamate synthase PgsB [Clostridia bacterium]